MKTRIKVCACGREFEDRTRNHNQKSCCRKCTNERLWRESGLSGKFRMRFNNILAHGGDLNDNEKEEIIDKLMNGVCDICHERTPFRELMIDHNHVTGAYRGVLCR